MSKFKCTPEHFKNILCGCWDRTRKEDEDMARNEIRHNNSRAICVSSKTLNELKRVRERQNDNQRKNSDLPSTTAERNSNQSD